MASSSRGTARNREGTPTGEGDPSTTDALLALEDRGVTGVALAQP